MRSTTIKGLDDGIYINLGGNTDIIEAVMNAGKAVDYLIYELTLTGAELLEFLAKFCVDSELTAKINAENRYNIKSYDW
jgi:hypothetical protein